MPKFKNTQRKSRKVRAIELFHRDSPFRQKVVKSRKVYTRKIKHRKNEQSSTSYNTR